MSILYINAAFRENSRTQILANHFLSRQAQNITEIKLGEITLQPLQTESLRTYNDAVASKDFSAEMFDYAKQFRDADEIVIAAPFWNYSIPAILHCYLELVCTQGITFDLSPTGEYYGLCKAKRITYITTAGGPIPEPDHAYCYIKSLAESFWEIPDVRYIKVDGIDMVSPQDAMNLIHDACRD